MERTRSATQHTTHTEGRSARRQETVHGEVWATVSTKAQFLDPPPAPLSSPIPACDTELLAHPFAPGESFG